MEDALAQYRGSTKIPVGWVLILVVMEDALAPFSVINYEK